MEATSVGVKVDGYPVDSHAEFLDELTELQQEYSHLLHDFTVFAATIEGFSSTWIEIDWEGPSSASSGYGTFWETGYVIIATRACLKPLQNFAVFQEGALGPGSLRQKRHLFLYQGTDEPLIHFQLSILT